MNALLLLLGCWGHFLLESAVGHFETGECADADGANAEENNGGQETGEDGWTLN